MVNYRQLNNVQKLTPSQLLNILVEKGTSQYKTFTIVMTKNHYIVADNTAPDIYKPVFKRNVCAISFWELCEFLEIK